MALPTPLGAYALRPARAPTPRLLPSSSPPPTAHYVQRLCMPPRPMTDDYAVAFAEDEALRAGLRLI